MGSLYRNLNRNGNPNPEKRWIAIFVSGYITGTEDRSETSTEGGNMLLSKSIPQQFATKQYWINDTS